MIIWEAMDTLRVEIQLNLGTNLHYFVLQFLVLHLKEYFVLNNLIYDLWGLGR